MKKGIAKLSLFFLAAGMVFGNASAAVSADEAAAGENSGAQSPAGTIGFVDLEQADFTVNVRSAADVETGEVVGILKNHDSVVIKKVTADGWYKIKSGDVKGYVAAYLIATGERADQIAAETAYRYATVQAAELNVRTSPDADGEVMCVLKEGDQAEIVASSGDWLKVCLAADSYGYIAGAYVETDVDYPTGRTIQQYEDELEGREAAWAAAPAEGKSEEEAPYAAAVAADSSAEAVYTEAAAPAETAPAQEAAAAATEVVSGGYVYTKEGDQAYTDSASSEIYTGETESYYEILGDGEPPAESYQVEADQGYEYYSEDAPAYEESAAADSSYAETGSDGSYSDGSYSEVSYSEESSGEVVYLDEDYSDGSYSDGSYTEESYSDGSYTAESYSDGTYTAETEAQTSAPAASSTGAEIAAYAQQFVGNPYVWGGTSLTQGADCSGFTMAVFAQFGVTLPHFAADQYSCGTPVSLDSLAPGDLIFFSSSGSIDHVAIYIGGGSMVHAANSKSGIIISSIDWMTPVAACRVV